MKDQKHMPAHTKFYRRDNFDDLRGKTREDVLNEIRQRVDDSLSDLFKKRRERMKRLKSEKKNEPRNKKTGRKKKA